MPTSVGTSSGHHHRQRPLLGLRHTPGRLALAVFRTPLWLYRRGWGWLLGRTFLMLVHVGRRTGRSHEMVAMILADDRDTGEVVILSGWGPDVDWLSNLRAGPARAVCVARDCFVPEHRFVGEDEAVSVVAAFRRRHPGRVRLATAILGWGDLRTDAALRDFVRGHPFVAFRPAADRSPLPPAGRGLAGSVGSEETGDLPRPDLGDGLLPG